MEKITEVQIWSTKANGVYAAFYRPDKGFEYTDKITPASLRRITAAVVGMTGSAYVNGTGDETSINFEK